MIRVIYLPRDHGYLSSTIFGVELGKVALEQLNTRQWKKLVSSFYVVASGGLRMTKWTKVMPLERFQEAEFSKLGSELLNLFQHKPGKIITVTYPEFKKLASIMEKKNRRENGRS